MKMGKSLGNTLEPNDLVQRFGSDAVRYFFLREVEFGDDGDYSEDRFINIVNAHLANTIGISFSVFFLSFLIPPPPFIYLGFGWSAFSFMVSVPTLRRKSS